MLITGSASSCETFEVVGAGGGGASREKCTWFWHPLIYVCKVMDALSLSNTCSNIFPSHISALDTFFFASDLSRCGNKRRDFAHCWGRSFPDFSTERFNLSTELCLDWKLSQIFHQKVKKWLIHTSCVISLKNKSKLKEGRISRI